MTASLPGRPPSRSDPGHSHRQSSTLLPFPQMSRRAGRRQAWMRRLSTPPRASTRTLSRSIQDLPSAERNEGARWALGFSFHRRADLTQPDEARPEYGSGTKALVASLAHRLPRRSRSGTFPTDAPASPRRRQAECWIAIDPIADTRFARRESSSQATPVGPWWFSWASGTGIARTA